MERSEKTMKKLLIMGLILALCVLSVPVAADISGISPDNGPTDGGTTVTISSNGDFLSANEPYEAHFDSDAGACTRFDDSTLTCTTPPHAVGTVPVTLWYFYGFFQVPGQTSFTYVDMTAPTLTGISPDSGTYLGGTLVTIIGTNLGSATEVKFGTSKASITSNTATSIVATTPPGTVGPQNVVITNGEGKTVTKNGAFTYTSWAVTGISPTSGPTAGGTPVTISGEGFLSDDGPYRATFDAIPGACTFVNSNQLTCTTPGPHVAGAVSVYVYNGAGFSQGPFSFTYGEGGSPVPEFPSTLLPATMIIGFLGAVLLIQRTRKQ
jgi:hypothetical protein